MLNRLLGEVCCRCKVVRTKKEVDGLPTCPACEAELEAEIAAKSEAKRRCLHCSAEMDKLVVQKVVIDKCPACGGVWLDAEELNLIQEAIKSGAGGDFATGMVVGMAIG